MGGELRSILSHAESNRKLIERTCRGVLPAGRRCLEPDLLPRPRIPTCLVLKCCSGRGGSKLNTSPSRWDERPGPVTDDWCRGCAPRTLSCVPPPLSQAQRCRLPNQHSSTSGSSSCLATGPFLRTAPWAPTSRRSSRPESSRRALWAHSGFRRRWKARALMGSQPDH